MNIAALVSGGVDSSVIVPLLKDMGFDPHIFYIKIGLEGKDDLMDCPAEEDIEITTFIAKKKIRLQIRHHRSAEGILRPRCKVHNGFSAQRTHT